MKRSFIISIIVLGLVIQCARGWSQTALPYYTAFDSAADKVGWTEYKLGVSGGLYDWQYSSFSAFSNPECLSHNYPVGGSQQTDDWFVSPEFDFSSGATIDSLRYAFSGFGTPGSGDTIGIYLLNGSPNPANASMVSMLYSFTDSTYLNDNTWRKTIPTNIPVVSGQSYIAFRYTTVANWLDVKLDNLSISKQTVGINSFPLNKDNVLIYPNPIKAFLTIEIADNLKIERLEIMDMQGKVVKTYSNNEKELNVEDLDSGQYLIQLQTKEARISKKIIIE